MGSPIPVPPARPIFAWAEDRKHHWRGQHGDELVFVGWDGMLRDDWHVLHSKGGTPFVVLEGDSRDGFVDDLVLWLRGNGQDVPEAPRS